MRVTPTHPQRSGPDHDGRFLVALQPSAPSRSASVRLRHAINARSSMDHSNLLRVWPLGQADERQLVAIERCAHPSLTDLLTSGPVEPGVCVHVMGGAAAAADALTRRGLVARDLTPDAVFVHPQHGGVLADLGIPPELILQPPLEQDPDLVFRSPEELLGQRLGPRSTVYSFGVLLFMALTQGHPYRGPGSDVHAALVAGTAPPASQGWRELPSRMDRVIARAIAPEPEQRYADVAELVRVVAAQLGGNVAPETAAVDSRADEPQPRPSSNGVAAPSQPKARTSTRSPRENGSTLAARSERETPRSRPPCSRQGISERRSTKRSAEVQSWPRPAKKDQGEARREAPGAARGQTPRPPEARPERAPAQNGAEGRPVEAHTVSAVSPPSTDRPGAQRHKSGSKPRRLYALDTGFSEAARRLVALVSAILTLAGAARSRVLTLLRRFGETLVLPVRRAAHTAARMVRGGASSSTPSRRRVVVPVVGALLASAVGGVALGRVVEADRGPTSVTQAGLTIQLPPGWEQVRLDPGRPAAFRGIAVGPAEERGSGLVAGRLPSQAAAEQMFGDAQLGGGRRTRVRLGELDGWRYTRLQPRLDLVGTGYVIPTTGGAVAVICHAPKDADPFLAECGRVAGAMVVSGERAVPLPSVDKSRERLTEVIVALRSSRAKGLQRLAAAEAAPGQVRAAASLQRSHRRAAQSLDRIPPLANGRSLAQLSAALRAAADAYGRLTAAVTSGRASIYREASRAVVREDEALRRELAQASGG